MRVLPPLLFLLAACRSSSHAAEEDQADEACAEPPQGATSLDPAVAAVLADVRALQRSAPCSAAAGAAVVAYLGGDDDLMACKMQGLWGKALRLAGAHAAAFASGRATVLADPDPWIGCEQGGGWGCYFEPVSPCNLTALGLSPAESATAEAVWGSSGWRPWSRKKPPDPNRPVLWSACGNQMNKYGARPPQQQAPAPHDHHSNDFWPMAPARPLAAAHAATAVSAWQAAFLLDLTQPQPHTRRYIDALAGEGRPPLPPNHLCCAVHRR